MACLGCGLLSSILDDQSSKLGLHDFLHEHQGPLLPGAQKDSTRLFAMAVPADRRKVCLSQGKKGSILPKAECRRTPRRVCRRRCDQCSSCSPPLTIACFSESGLSCGENSHPTRSLSLLSGGKKKITQSHLLSITFSPTA